MALLAINLPVTLGGTTALRFDFEGRRSGSENDKAMFRVVRRVAGQADVILPGAPQLVLPQNRDTRGWTFIDANVPTTDIYNYVVQINRTEGDGTFFLMSLSGVHYRK